MPGANLTFDQYGEAIRDTAHVLYLLTEPSVLGWGVTWRSTGRISIQFGVEGGSKILHGMSRNDTIIFVFQTTNYADGVFFHGYHAPPHDVGIIAPDRHFTIITKVRVAWAAIAIPVDLFKGFFPDRHSAFTSQNSVITLDTKELNELIAVIRRAADSPPTSTEVTAGDLQILKLLTRLLEKERPKQLIPDKDTQATETLMRMALEYVRLKPDENITIEDLAGELKVNARTLLRGFQLYLRTGVKQYLLMRQLNLCRRAIRRHVMTSRRLQPRWLTMG